MLLDDGVRFANFLNDGSYFLIGANAKELWIIESGSLAIVSKISTESYSNAALILSKDKVISLGKNSMLETYENAELVNSIRLPEEGLSLAINSEHTEVLVGGNVNLDY